MVRSDKGAMILVQHDRMIAITVEYCAYEKICNSSYLVAFETRHEERRYLAPIIVLGMAAGGYS